MLRARHLMPVAAALALALAACGNTPRLVPATGKVTHNGKPVTGGSIWFHPDEGNVFQGDRPSSQLQLDGSFSARTFPHGDGISPGRYRVTLSPDLAGRLGKPDLGNASKTPWSIDIREDGLKDHVFEVK